MDQGLKAKYPSSKSKPFSILPTALVPLIPYPSSSQANLLSLVFLLKKQDSGPILP